MTIIDTDYTKTACIVVGILVIIDYMLGVAYAALNHKLSSGVMYKGLFKKCAYFGLLFTAYTLEATLPYLGIEMGKTLTVGVTTMAVALELTSIIENTCKLNPEIPIAQLFQLFHLNNPTEEPDTQEPDTTQKEAHHDTERH